MADESRLTRTPVALIVSEQEWGSRSLDSVLAPNGYAILRAYNGRQAVERAIAAKPDVVFIDALLPDCEGVALCAELRRTGAVEPTAPIFVVRSGAAGRRERLAALEAGAWDLLTVPLDASEILARLECYMKARMLADRAEQSALIDGSTGAYSWHGIARRAREIGAAASRHRRGFTCVVLSLQPAVDPAATEAPLSDAHLRHVADAIRKAIRTSDALGRIGDTALVVLAPETGRDGAEVLARRLTDALRDPDLDAPASGGPVAGLTVAAYAVDDFGEAGQDPLEILLRARSGLDKPTPAGPDVGRVAPMA